MSEEKPGRHPGLAAILSFIFNGLGQLYNGQITKGLLIIFLSSLGLFFVILGGIFIALSLLNKVILPDQLSVGISIFAISLIFTCIVGIYSIYDAYKSAGNKQC